MTARKTGGATILFHTPLHPRCKMSRRKRLWVES